jgi:hypothetical protein
LLDFNVKVCVEGHSEKAEIKRNQLVAGVLAAIEVPAWSGTGMTICGAGEERTAFTSRSTFIEGPFIQVRARYTRNLGDPYS